MTLVPTACRIATDSEVPGGARQLVRKAASLGWTASATYAAGPVESKGAPDGVAVLASVAVRLAHPAGHRAVAVWTSDARGTMRADFGAYRPAGWPHWTVCGLAEVKAVVLPAVALVEQAGPVELVA